MTIARTLYIAQNTKKIIVNLSARYNNSTEKLQPDIYSLTNTNSSRPALLHHSYVKGNKTSYCKLYIIPKLESKTVKKLFGRPENDR